MPKKSKWFTNVCHLAFRHNDHKKSLCHLIDLIKGEKHLHEDAIKMIKGVIKISKIKARDIMVARPKMVVIDSNSSMDDMVEIVIDSGHSRFPVTGENRDEIKGFLLAKDLLKHHHGHHKVNIESLMRPAFFVPDSKRLDVLLKEFRQQHKHLAIVMDEYGGVAGLITIEDILEQIVGNIEDELDNHQDDHIELISKNKFLINALTSIEEFNEHFHASLDTSKFDTIGGLVTHSIGHVPKKGEKVVIADRFEFRVLHTSHKHVKLLRLKINH